MQAESGNPALAVHVHLPQTGRSGFGADLNKVQLSSPVMFLSCMAVTLQERSHLLVDEMVMPKNWNHNITLNRLAGCRMIQVPRDMKSING